MRIGDLKKRITFLSDTKTSDGMGGYTTVPKNEATVFAAIWPTSSAEIVAANSISLVVTHKIRIRYRSTIRASWRIKYGDKYYSIVSIINPNMSNKFLDIMAKEAAS